MTGNQPQQTREAGDEALVAVAEGAEAFVELICRNNVDYIFLNPGTDTFPVQEALSKFHAEGRACPQVVVSLDESVGMAAAHGHFMVSGRPQVVFVHVDLGTQQVGGALHNAQRGRAAVVLCAGRAPLTFENEMRGSRSSFIHWIQEQYDQSGVVRGYTKWDYELRRNENIQHVVQRAFRISATEPYGPVYLTLPRELLMEKMEGIRPLPQERHQPATSPQADPQALERAAAWLVEAQHPLILTNYLGRHPEAVPALVRLAELLAIPVAETRTRMNFPTAHPLNAGTSPMPHLAEADAILVIDHDVPYVPILAQPNPNAKIIYIDIDPIKQDIPLWGFPADLLIQADSSKALPVLLDAVRASMTARDRTRIELRGRELADQHRRMRQGWREVAQAKEGQRPIAPDYVALFINVAIDEEALILDESVTNSVHVGRLVERSLPGTYFMSGGSSLGWGLGAALGAKLAAPQRTVISLVGDGSFIFGCPTSALWAADVYKVPFLTVIFNNQVYNAPKASLRAGYGPQSYSERTGNWVGMDIAPPPDYAAIARACRAYGETVDDPAQVKPALQRSLDQVRGGTAAVLDILIERP